MSDTAAGTYEIRWAEDKDWIPAMHMIWKTFLKFEAVDYTEEGIRNFYDFITDEHLYKSFLQGRYQMMVALDGERVIGAASVRNYNHLSLLFVDEEYHHRGIGRDLMRRMCEYLGYHVCTLKRIRIMNLTLDGLKCGEYREICGDEWKKLNELIRDSSSETVIRTGGQHGNISGRTNKRTGAEAERSGKGILSGRPGDHEQQRVRRTVRSTGKNGKGNRNRSGRQPNC